MQWNVHSSLEGRHSILSPSNHSWKNYDDSKLISFFESSQRKVEGTKLHAWAEEVINSVHLTKEILAFHSKRSIRIDIADIREKGNQIPYIRDSRAKETMFMYIADAIKYDMVAEQKLVYDYQYCFGTADSIQFDGHLLRIHDLKTGENPVTMDQLIIYAALFCLEYGYHPAQLIYELRIYQTEQITIYTPTIEEVVVMMNRIVHLVDVLHKYERGEL